MSKDQKPCHYCGKVCDLDDHTLADCNAYMKERTETAENEIKRLRAALITNHLYWAVIRSAYFCIHCGAEHETRSGFVHAGDCIINALKGGEE